MGSAVAEDVGMFIGGDAVKHASRSEPSPILRGGITEKYVHGLANLTQHGLQAGTRLNAAKSLWTEGISIPGVEYQSPENEVRGDRSGNSDR